MARNRKDQVQVVEVTTAAESRADEISARQRRYVISMTIRTLCFIVAVLTYSFSPILAAILILGSFLLPLFAVTAANVGAELRTGAPEVVNPWETETYAALPPGGPVVPGESRA